MTYVLAALLVIAGAFGLIGSYGLIRLKDGMQRLHAPTKASTVGLGAALLASMLHGIGLGGFSWQEIIVMVFIFVTAPITANYLSKTHLWSGRYAPPPAAPTVLGRHSIPRSTTNSPTCPSATHKPDRLVKYRRRQGLQPRRPPCILSPSKGKAPEAWNTA
ncbi:cation:proton antiporter [Paragemmobacter aquarius]|uniref:cation:proton antiporter n=1 Tax=Paragemmobacter aquarius TaxID=2169400 RepID=UPI001E3494D7|nr:monovalent cation/H(+) antiporter subunit G [Gemmobacter aquarius]